MRLSSPTTQLLLVLPTILATETYPNLVSSALARTHDALGSNPTRATNSALGLPSKPGWDNDWSGSGLLEPAVSAAIHAASVVGDRVGARVGAATWVGAHAGRSTGSVIEREGQTAGAAQDEDGHYRTIRETVEWVKPTQLARPIATLNSAPTPPAAPTPTPEPAHISHLTPHLVSLGSVLSFFIKHPYRFTRAYFLPYSTNLLAALATRLVWPVLRLPLSLAWATAATLFAIATSPLWWTIGLWDRWGELGVFFAFAVAIGAGMGVLGAVASGPGVRGLVGRLVGRAETNIGGKAEARWETIPRAKGRAGRRDERVGRDVGAYPPEPVQAVHRSVSLDTIRPTQTQKTASPASAFTSHPKLSHCEAGSSLRIGDSWASSSPSADSTLAHAQAQAAPAPASASSSDMGRESSRDSDGGRAGRASVAGVGRAGQARNAASVALAEAKRRVQEIRVAKERERGNGAGVGVR